MKNSGCIAPYLREEERARERGEEEGASMTLTELVIHSPLFKLVSETL